jgi:hypothetical protein
MTNQSTINIMNDMVDLWSNVPHSNDSRWNAFRRNDASPRERFTRLTIGRPIFIGRTSFLTRKSTKNDDFMWHRVALRCVYSGDVLSAKTHASATATTAVFIERLVSYSRYRQKMTSFRGAGYLGKNGVTSGMFYKHITIINWRSP